MTTTPRRRSWPTPLWLLPLASLALVGGRCGKSSSDGHHDGPSQPCTKAEECVPPPSFCADDTTLAYFTSGACENARCVWSTRQSACGGPCRTGGCLSTGTSGGAGGLGGAPAASEGDAAPPQGCTTPMDCVPPPSFCADATTLAYYTAPTCQGGACRWSTAQTGCMSLCRNGGCASSGTTGGVGGLGGAPAGDTGR
jgi:hypothetical protein